MNTEKNEEWFVGCVCVFESIFEGNVVHTFIMIMIYMSVCFWHDKRSIVEYSLVVYHWTWLQRNFEKCVQKDIKWLCFIILNCWIIISQKDSCQQKTSSHLHNRCFMRNDISFDVII